VSKTIPLTLKRKGGKTMKFKRTVLLATFVVTLGLLLGTGAAQAEPIVIVDGDTATGIQNLDVDGTLYNVAFLFISADELYGDTPFSTFPTKRPQKRPKWLQSWLSMSTTEPQVLVRRPNRVSATGGLDSKRIKNHPGRK
jgi:hypothetical protein